MNIIISILLYLNILQPNSTVKLSEIKYDVSVYQNQINTIVCDPQKLNSVVGVESQNVSTVIVIDDTTIR